MKNTVQIIAISFLIALVSSCAKKGRPNGGPKDVTAPILVIAKPPNNSITFDKEKIRIEFDEYIILKDLNKQLVVSPPLKNPPLITPQGVPSKHITIKILDTLKPNTTYTFNFGNAVQDNNENNKLESFKYVLSTGNYIDSLTLQGNVKDALTKNIPKEVSVLLYKLDSTYYDSIIYKHKPYYVASTLDSSTYNFSNLQKGAYKLIALKQTNKDYIYNPKTDKIAFLNDTITLPQDSIIDKNLQLFKAKQPYTFKRGKEVSKGKIELGFEGERKDFKIHLLSETSSDFKSFYQLEKDKDTLNYWFTPQEKDSLNLVVSTNTTSDTTTVYLRKKKIDSLSISSSINGTLHLKDTLFFMANNPITGIDSTKISLVDKDTAIVPFRLYKKDFTKYALLFEKRYSEKYRLTVLPDAFTDLYFTTNDSLNVNFNTKTVEDYGSIILEVKQVVKNTIIIELLAKDGTVLERKIMAEKNGKVEFTSLSPSTYSIRAVIDANSNNQWDAGNFLKQLQPEKIIYLDKELTLRANWILNETLTIE